MLKSLTSCLYWINPGSQESFLFWNIKRNITFFVLMIFITCTERNHIPRHINPLVGNCKGLCGGQFTVFSTVSHIILCRLFLLKIMVNIVYSFIFQGNKTNIWVPITYWNNTVCVTGITFNCTKFTVKKFQKLGL